MWGSVFGGLGVCVVAASIRAVAWLRSEISRPGFASAGFRFARCGPFCGWLSRDIRNQDWIIWCVKQQRMFRGPTPDAFYWIPSHESREECIRLGDPHFRH